MKPTTPQEFANCYGTFIADLVIIAFVLPNYFNTWLRTTLPDVESVYKLNMALFSSYTASTSGIRKKPKKPTFSKDYSVKQYNTDVRAYNKSVTLAWTATTIDLKNALTCAEVDPILAAKILASFAKLKPSEIDDFAR
jgi:hypothetical protein